MVGYSQIQYKPVGLHCSHVHGSLVFRCSTIVSGLINLHGSYHFDLQATKKRQRQLCPLRTAEPLF
jgi:hypothetical protein